MDQLYGQFSPNDDYKLLFLIKDGGRYDLDRTEDGVIWDPLALVGIPVTGVTLSPATLNLPIGGSYDISVGVNTVP